MAHVRTGANPRRWGWRGYALLALTVWLGAEAIKVPVSLRAPVGLSVRIAPQSSEVLGRAAEAELAAGRTQAAQAIAGEALSKAPFNVRALRVWGLAEAGDDSSPVADEVLTLAGNWSLRDTPTHAWLVRERLLKGNYASSFAHADTLVRRRTEMYPQVFDLFATALTADPRAQGAIVPLLEASPPWRRAFVLFLAGREDGDMALAQLAIAMQTTPRPFTNDELSIAYLNWVNETRYPLVLEVRRRLGRPAATSILEDGAFEEDAAGAIPPFSWMLESLGGVNAEVRQDDLAPANAALRVNFDGQASATAASQIVTLIPGPAVLSGRFRRETALESGSIRWSVLCAHNGAVIGSLDLPEGPAGVWQPFTVRLNAPADCALAQIVLVTTPGDQRAATAVWFDDLAIRT